LGGGAIGAFYGGYLSKAGLRVSVVCRSNYEVVKQSGFTIKSILGDYQFKPTHVYQPAENPDEFPDYLLVCTKVLSQDHAPGFMAAFVGEKTTIVLIQNGIDIELGVQKAFPNNKLISGIAFICVSQHQPGQIHHIDYGRLVLGGYPSGQSDEVDYLTACFNQVKLPCRGSATIQKERWQKLIWNAPFNPLSVLTGVSTDKLIAAKDSYKLVKGIMKEVQVIAASCGHILPDTLIDKNLTDTQSMPPYKTSMLLDYEAGKPIELEAILGDPISIAQNNNVDCPLMMIVYGLLKLKVG
jgi:2-dehydropantoate 2-reductase